MAKPTKDSDLHEMELWDTDGVDFEIWKDKEGNKYQLSIEREEDDESGHPNIERDFESVEVVK